jgi:hypothetical protein
MYTLALLPIIGVYTFTPYSMGQRQTCILVIPTCGPNLTPYGLNQLVVITYWLVQSLWLGLPVPLLSTNDGINPPWKLSFPTGVKRQPDSRGHV